MFCARFSRFSSHEKACSHALDALREKRFSVAPGRVRTCAGCSFLRTRTFPGCSFLSPSHQATDLTSAARAAFSHCHDYTLFAAAVLVTHHWFWCRSLDVVHSCPHASPNAGLTGCPATHLTPHASPRKPHRLPNTHLTRRDETASSPCSSSIG
jgi:hypothetical protein